MLWPGETEAQISPADSGAIIARAFNQVESLNDRGNARRWGEAPSADAGADFICDNDHGTFDFLNFLHKLLTLIKKYIRRVIF